MVRAAVRAALDCLSFRVRTSALCPARRPSLGYVQKETNVSTIIVNANMFDSIIQRVQGCVGRVGAEVQNSTLVASVFWLWREKQDPFRLRLAKARLAKSFSGRASPILFSRTAAVLKFDLLMT